MSPIILLILAQPMNLNIQPPSTFRCDGGISCSVSGRTLYISGSGSGGGGKVAEAYMADASITAQVANVAYSADAGYYSTEFITNPADCSAGQYATTIAANGNLTCAQVAYSQVSSTPTLYNQTIEDEATPLTQRTNVNFTGAGVSCIDSGGKTVCTISGGGAGSANVVEVEVDFGANGDTTASTVVTGQAWVTGTSKIVCAPTMLATTDRSEGMEDVVIEEIVVAVHTRSVGVGFTVTAGSAQGRAIGKYLIHCTGA